MADTPGALLRPPLAYVQSPSYSQDDLEQGGSIEDAPDLVPPDEPPYTPTDPGTEASCLERYQYNLGTCYAGALAEVNEERRVLINACYADHQGAIDAALAAVEEAEANVVAMQKGLYQPAEPLILTLPVAHCRASSYAVEDQVLIDFPEREPGASGMGVWDSARVIGWSSNTKNCLQKFIINYFINYPQCYVSGDLEQEVEEGDDGTPVVVKHVYDYQSIYWKQMTNEQQQFILVESYHLYDLLFYRWSDGWAGLAHTAFNVTKSEGFYSFIWETPQKIYFKPFLTRDFGIESDVIALQPCERCYPEGENQPWMESAGVSSMTDAEDNPYNENDFQSVMGWGAWSILNENGFADLVIASIPFPPGWQDDEDGWDVPGWDDSGLTFGAYDAAPAQIVLWAPKFRIGLGVRSGTFECCVFAKTGTITDVYNQLYHEYSRTSFGGSIYDYM